MESQYSRSRYKMSACSRAPREWAGGRRYNMANDLGKRYQCETCGTVALCTKAGEGPVTCCDKDMALQDARRLPSSD